MPIWPNKQGSLMAMVCTCKGSRFFTVCSARVAAAALIDGHSVWANLVMRSVYAGVELAIINVVWCGMLTHDDGMLG